VNGDHDGEGRGHGDDARAFADAVKNAWEDAKGKGHGPGTYEIKKIFVETSNPINEYRVQVKKI
jgi:hypothetical protein